MGVPVLSKLISDCPISKEDIASHLNLEDFDHHSASLAFACRAECSDRTYWIWKYIDSDGDSCQAVVTQLHDREREDLCEIGVGSFGKEFSNDEDLVFELLRAGV